MSNAFAHTANNTFENTDNNYVAVVALPIAFVDWSTLFETGVKTLYRFVLSGDNESPPIADITIPISSFQSRLLDGKSHFLSVVVPDFDTYSAIITARSNGDMYIYIDWYIKDVLMHVDTMAFATLENIATHEEGKKKSITLSGHDSDRTWKTYLTYLKYVSHRDRDSNTGKKTLRVFPPYPFVHVGGVVSYDDGVSADELTVGQVSIAISVDSQTMTVYEA